MITTFILTLGLLLGGVDSPEAEPIVTQDSDAFRHSSSSLSVEEERRFWDLVRHGSAGWAASTQVSEVQHSVSGSNPAERVLLITGRPTASLLVAEGARGAAGPQLTYAASWDSGIKTASRTADWWASLSAKLSVLEANSAGCTPRLASKDNAVVFLRATRPTGSFEIITYGLPPRFPETASKGIEMSACAEALMGVLRLLEEPAIASLEAKAQLKKP